ncbi:hypothetical protein CVT25_004394 [Psilocybe cyanescens]|uniref:Uncharacterized protein n=1 Tax=Psilocybe cyanescens TaxID=93625 RepID=A0A409W4E2_PSICY|nr:hypothetical protein CVT25_004394 [Psilocybe cyanescens]
MAHNFLNEWETSNANICTVTKQGFLINLRLDLLGPYFAGKDKIFHNLFNKLGELCTGYNFKKTKIAKNYDAFLPLVAVHKEAIDRNHNTFLKIVDEAILLQEKKPAEFQYPLQVLQMSSKPPVTPTRKKGKVQ